MKFTLSDFWDAGKHLRHIQLAVCCGLLMVLFSSCGGEPTATPAVPADCSNGVIVPYPADTQELVRDCEILLEIGPALAGDGWARLGWRPDARIDGWWRGVEIGGNPLRVQGLEVFYRHIDTAETMVILNGSLSAELGSLTGLIRLNLNGHQLTGEIPASLGELKDLELLDLSSNELSGEIPASLGNLASLQKLSLDYNQLTGRIPDSLGNLSRLTELGLHDNQLTGQIPDSIGNLPELWYLILWGNRLMGEIPASFGNLKQLRLLSLHDNQLTGEVPSELGNMKNLGALLLNGNDLTGALPASLGRLTRVSWMEIHPNRLTGCLPPALAAIPKNDFDATGLPFCHDPTPPTCVSGIAVPNPQDNPGLVSDCEALLEMRKTLTGPGTQNWSPYGPITGWNGVIVEGTPGRVQALVGFYPYKVTGQISPAIGNLTELREINFSHYGIDGEIPSSLGNLTHLTHLELEDNRLSGEIPPSLGNLINLESLKLRWNKLTGCVPATLRGTPYNDFLELRLPFCKP